jgi:hypothetical protein
MMTVADVLEQHRRINGNSDPRLTLDQYCWSYIITWDRTRYENANFLIEIEEWCDRVLGSENWFRMFDKFWFTDEQCLTMTKLVWGGGPDGSQAA